MLVSLHLSGGEGEGVAGFQSDLPLPEGLDPVFRPLGVQHNSDGQIQLLPNRLDHVDLGLMLLMGSVGEIQPGHIEPLETHLPKHGGIGAGRADGGDDLGLSHKLAPPRMVWCSLFALYHALIEIHKCGGNFLNCRRERGKTGFIFRGDVIKCFQKPLTE